MRGRALVALVLGALALAGCGGGTKTVTQTTTVVHSTTVRVTTSAPPSSSASEACAGDAMSGSFNMIAGSAGAGNVSYRLRVVNASPVACYVSGLPQVQLIGSGGTAWMAIVISVATRITVERIEINSMEKPRSDLNQILPNRSSFPHPILTPKISSSEAKNLMTSKKGIKHSR